MSEETLAQLGLAAHSLLVGLTFHNCSASTHSYTASLTICIISFLASYCAYLTGKNRTTLKPALKSSEGSWVWPWTKRQRKKSVSFQETVPIVMIASSSQVTTTSTEVRCLKNDANLEEVTLDETTSTLTTTTSDIIPYTETPAPSPEPTPAPALLPQPPPRSPRRQSSRSKARDDLDKLLRQQTNLELAVNYLESQWRWQRAQQKTHSDRWKKYKGTGKAAEAAQKQWELAKGRCQAWKEDTEKTKEKLEHLNDAIARAERNMIGLGR